MHAASRCLVEVTQAIGPSGEVVVVTFLIQSLSACSLGEAGEASRRNRARKVTLPPSIDQLQQQGGSRLTWMGTSRG